MQTPNDQASGSLFANEYSLAVRKKKICYLGFLLFIEPRDLELIYLIHLELNSSNRIPYRMNHLRHTRLCR